MTFQPIKQAYAANEADAGGAGSASGVDLGEKFTLGIGQDPVKDIYSKPTDLSNIFVSNVMVIGGIILTAMFILAGFKFLQDTTKGKEEAVKILQAALIGFLLMFSSFWIVQIIQVITGANIIL